MKKKKSAKRTALIVLCVVLGLVLIVSVVALLLGGKLLGLIKRNNGDFDPMSEEDKANYLATETNDTVYDDVIDPDDIDWGTGGKISKSDNVYNLMLIGQDRRSNQGRSRSDSMILCTLNKKTKTLTMTSFMRDMYVQIPGNGENRINASYAWGGIDLLDKTIEQNFGLEVDGNVEIDFYGFMDVVDEIGGLDIELTKQEAQYLNKRGNWDVYNEKNWDLKEGTNHMNGSQVLAYCRTRYVGNGDYERTARQRKVLTLFLQKCKTMSISEIYGVLKLALPLVTTDLSNNEIIGFVTMLVPMLDDLEIITQRVPADGAYKSAMVKGMAVLVPDLDKNRQLLKDTIETE